MLTGSTHHHVLLAIMPVFFLSTGLKNNWGVGGAAVFAAAVLLVASVSGTMIGVHIAGKILKWGKGRRRSRRGFEHEAPASVRGEDGASAWVHAPAPAAPTIRKSSQSGAFLLAPTRQGQRQWRRGPPRAQAYAMSVAARNAATIDSIPCRSLSLKRFSDGLSMSNTPYSLPPLIKGTTISAFDALSQAI